MDVAWPDIFRLLTGNIGILLLNFRSKNTSVNISLKNSRRQVWTVTAENLDSKKISVNGRLLRRGFILQVPSLIG